MAIDVSFASAFGFGALSFLSPCVLPLVPPYLCYMAGVSVEDFKGAGAVAARAPARLALLGAAVCFVLGFTTVFVALGAGATSIGQFLRAWQEYLAIAAGVLIILMGLNFLGVLRIGMFSREARLQSSAKPATLAGSYLMGLAFAFGWTPCIGPVLGPILTLAGARGTVADGALLLAVYSLGLGLPFIVAAMFSGAFMRFLGRFRVHLGRVEKVIGVLLVVAGALFVSGGIQWTAYWILETFPLLQKLG